MARAAHEDLCLYSFEHGALDFSWGSIDSGHVSVPIIDIASELPQRDITVETWIKLRDGGASHDWAGPVSAAQDDSANEFGWTILQRSNDDTGVFEWSFGLSTEGGSDANGSGELTYLHSPESTHALDEWHHVAATYDGTTMNVLIDGQITATDSSTQSGAIRYPHPTYGSLL